MNNNPTPSKQGGSRPGSGRHKLPADQRKVQVYAFIPQYQIDLLGGKEAVKKYIETEVLKKAFELSVDNIE